MKKLFFTLTLFSFLIANSQNSRDELALDNNWKNCLIKEKDGKFFVGGKMKWLPNPPFTTRKIAVVNENLTENFTLTNVNFPVSSWNYDEIYAVASYRTPYKRYVGGDLVYYNGVYVNGMMRINTDGSLDTTFTLNNLTNPAVNCDVRSILVQEDGKVMIGGNFLSYLGSNKKHIARLHENGTVDTTFNTTGTGFNDEIYCIKILPDGKYLVSGKFTSYNGVPINMIARLNNNGTLDTSFNVSYPLPTTFNSNNTIRTFLIQNDGKIVIGGDFEISICVLNEYPSGNCVGSLNFNKIARLNSNGTIDATFMNNAPSTEEPGSYGFNRSFTYNGVTSNIAKVFTITQLSNNRIFIGGIFDNFSSVFTSGAVNCISILDSNGNLDTTFSPAIGPNSGVHASLVESTGNIVLVGDFSKYDNIINNGIVRISQTGIVQRPVFENNEVSTGKEFLKQSELINSEITIYPNPAANVVNILSKNNEINCVFMTDVNGRTVKNVNIANATEAQINISDLAAGVYIMKITSNEGIITKKIIKK